MIHQQVIKVSNVSRLLSFSFQVIESSKADMGSKNEVISQLKRRLSQIELERTQLQDNVYDAEQTLRTAAKDREYLNIYVKALHAAFEKVRILNQFSCIEAYYYIFSMYNCTYIV